MTTTSEENIGEDVEDSSDVESDFEEVEASEEDMAAITQLEEQLQSNPNLYDKHVEYLALLRKCSMNARLRSARQQMHSRFPLSEALWLEWLGDEESSLKSAKDVQELENLYLLAVEDYLSIAIWLKFLKFLLEKDEEVKSGSKEGKAKMRLFYEQALSAGGLHVSEGGRLWQTCRQYEMKHVGDLDPKDAHNPVAQLLLRQLQVPVQDGRQTLKDWCKYTGKHTTDVATMENALPGHVKAAYAKAQAAVQARAPYEQSVAAGKPADLNLLAAYTAYIQLEQASGLPARVQCMYERALAKFPVTHVLWLQYGHYLEQHLNVTSTVKRVYARAVRNCPWVGSLWTRSMRALERGGALDSEHEELYNAALGAGMETPEDYMEVSLARIDSIRRHGPDKMGALRIAFRSTVEMMETFFPDYVDRSLRIPSYWATCELEIAKDHAAGRQVWEEALRSQLGTYAEAVAAYVAFELATKHVKEARSIFRQYHRRKMHESGNVAICEAWLRFEREHGSAEDYFQAFVKAEPVLSEAASAVTEAAQPQLAAETKAAANKGRQLSKADAKQLRQEKDPNFGKPDKPQGQGKKRRKGLGFQEEKETKRAKTAEQPVQPRSAEFLSSGTQDVNMVDPSKGAETAQPKIEVVPSTHVTASPTPSSSAEQKRMPPPATTTAAEPPPADESPAAGSSGRGGDQPAVGEHQRTAFVKGIAPEAVQDDLRAVFEACGEIMEVSMPEDRHFPSKNRGFAYVTFSSPEGLRSALAMGSPELRGQKLAVAGAHRPVGDDDRVAFVLNLAPETTSEAVEVLLGTCGTIKSVRIPLDRHTSQPRGFAYVEFETSKALQNAVDMTGIELGGRNLKISVATPSERNGPRGAGRGTGRGRGPQRGRGGRPPAGQFSQRGLENGGRGFEGQARGSGRAGRGHIDLGGGGGNPFRPRAVVQGGGAPKSNSDFRAMLKK